MEIVQERRSEMDQANGMTANLFRDQEQSQWVVIGES